jgi:hypothetical protein
MSKEVPDEWKATLVDVSTDLVTITPFPALLGGVYVNDSTSAHAIPIYDGSTLVYKIPASARVGNSYNLGPTRCETSLIIDPDDAATGSITVLWRDLARFA